jgi:flagellar basal body-associated protein FliL
VSPATTPVPKKKKDVDPTVLYVLLTIAIGLVIIGIIFVVIRMRGDDSEAKPQEPIAASEQKAAPNEERAPTHV